MGAIEPLADDRSPQLTAFRHAQFTFGGLLDVLAAKGYEFVRVDELLDSDHTGGSMAAQTK